MGGTKLIVFVEENLRLQYSIKVLTIHQVEIGSSKFFIYSKVKKRMVEG